MRLMILALAVFILPHVPAQGEVAPSVDSCPGATSWSRSHSTFAGDTPRAEAAISDDDLFKELYARVDRDQAARRVWLATPNDEALARSVNEIDSANLTWLRKLISEKGFPTAAQVGKQGVHLAWVLLQHADQDPQLQRELLPILEQRYSAGELPANDLARLTDRILLADGNPQRYGTQFDWFSGEFKLPDPGRLAEIDKERARLGLMPLRDYVCTLGKAREGAK